MLTKTLLHHYKVRCVFPIISLFLKCAIVVYGRDQRHVGAATFFMQQQCASESESEMMRCTGSTGAVTARRRAGLLTLMPFPRPIYRLAAPCTAALCTAR